MSFAFLTTLLDGGAHFVVRFKERIGYRILERFAVPQAPATAGFRLTSDWTIRLPGWEIPSQNVNQFPAAEIRIDHSL